MIIVGTFLGGVAAWTMLDMSFRDVMAVAAGFGYYSLSSMLINQLADVSLGSMALISNMVRELVTLLFAPLFARVFGGLGPLSAAGAASDTCLPAIIRTSGERNTILGIFSGMVLTIAVPIFVTSIFAWLVTQSNKKRNQPVDASERLAYLYTNPTISFLQTLYSQRSIMPLSIFKRLFICFCFALLTALCPRKPRKQKNGTLPPALETAQSHPACRCPARQSRPRRRDRKRPSLISSPPTSKRPTRFALRPDPQGSGAYTQGNAQRPAPQLVEYMLDPSIPGEAILPLRRAP